MVSEDLSVFGAIDDERHGVTLPRIYTPPLRPLDKNTSNGFAVIAFAEIMLHVHLYPWQQWLLVHALELLEDGSYRFRKVIVLVARQNGKTTLMGVLAAWWLFVDSNKHPDRVPPVKFLVVGAAQTLDNAKGPYNQVKEWCNPQPSTDEEEDLVIPDLAAMTQKFVNTNGEEAIITRSKARYIVRADKNIRAKSAARVVFDELVNSILTMAGMPSARPRRPYGRANYGAFRTLATIGLWRCASRSTRAASLLTSGRA